MSTSPGTIAAEPAPPPPAKSPRGAIAFVLVVLAYALLASAAQALAPPPGYAAPLNPAAGVALVGVLLHGNRVAPAAAVGAFVAWVTVAEPRDLHLVGGHAVALLIGVGAALQAAWAAWLVRRYVRRPLTLEEPRDAGLFLALAGPLGCMPGASIAHAALFASDALSLSQLPASLLTWWLGDSLGVLIMAPIAMTLAGVPRDAWAPRRLTVGLPLLATGALLAIGIAAMVRDDASRLANRFERDVLAASAAVAAELREPLYALQGMHSLFIGSDRVTREEMDRAARPWLRSGLLEAIAWSERIPRDAPAAPEADAPADPGVEPRASARNATAARTLEGAVLATRYVVPLEPNRAAIGTNLLAAEPARAAVRAAVASGAAHASVRHRREPTPDGSAPTAVEVHLPVYVEPEPALERRAPALRGVITVSLRLDEALAAQRVARPGYLDVCLVETETAQRLAGAADCASPAGRISRSIPFGFAGRRWEFRASAVREHVPDGQPTGTWQLAAVGLLGAAMLGALLLVVTGRARRIELAVRDRTASLEAEVLERERTQTALRESEQRFRNILNTVPIGVLYTDLDGHVRQSNPRFQELTGYSDGELQALPAFAWIHPDDRGADRELLGRLAAGQVAAARRQTRIVAKAGRQIVVQFTATLLRDTRGRPRRIVAVFEDIGEHLRLVEAERARELAEASNRAKSEFLSRMSHELRTPLNAMLGFAQLLELDDREPLADPQRQWVGQIVHAGWHLLEMINDVLDLSRIDTGNLELQIGPVALPQAIEESVAMVANDAARRSIGVSVDVEPDAAAVLGDATRVKQILTNLLTNAVKYNVDNGRIRVEARTRVEGVVAIAVIDSGQGMSPDQLAGLFQPFNRLGRERTAQPGTGIGLVISRRLAELMGGRLDAYSASGEGSVFTLLLPRVAAAPAAPCAPEPPLPASDGYRRRLVHYVEDNETNVEVIRSMLGRRPQVQLEVSGTGLAGLACIRATPPDLVLLDMHLPDIEGIELLRRLRADPLTARIPVAVVSADALEAQIEQAMAAGATDYLTKPVGIAELLRVVDRLLGGLSTRGDVAFS